MAYTHAIDLVGLAVAAVGLAGIVGLHRKGWVASVPYVLLALIMWAGMLQSGVHMTIAGVLVGLTISVRPRLDQSDFARLIQKPADEFQEAHRASQEAVDEDHEAEARSKVEKKLGYLHGMTDATGEASERVISLLDPWISYVALPLSALSNIQIHFTGESLGSITSPLVLAIIAGLVIGKPLGFLSFSWIATRLGLARRPDAVSWPMVGSVGALAGIGFTISLFIARLAFSDRARLESASVAILIASCLAGLIGYICLHRLNAGD